MAQKTQNGPKWPQNGHFWPKIANFSKLADFRGTGHIPPNLGFYGGYFMSTSILDDSPPFSRFLGKSDFLTPVAIFLCGLNGVRCFGRTISRIARVARGVAENSGKTKVDPFYYLSSAEGINSKLNAVRREFQGYLRGGAGVGEGGGGGGGVRLLPLKSGCKPRLVPQGGYYLG